MNHFSFQELTKASAVFLDSRQLKKGDVFFAIQGEKNHGLAFLDSVLPTASAVVSDQIPTKQQQHQLRTAGVSWYYHPQLSAHNQFILKNFWQQHYQLATQPNIIAVTGTNGKSSIVSMLAQCLDHTQAIGTITDTPLTTPDSSTLHRTISKAHADGSRHIALEVSSHALCQRRIDGLAISSAHFTNLTPDHGDYHPTMDIYRKTKKTLFHEYGLDHAVIHITDDFSEELVQQTYARIITVVGSNLSPRDDAQVVSVQADEINTKGQKVTIAITPAGGTARTITIPDILPLYGDFGLRNLGSIVAELAYCGFSDEMIAKKLGKLQSVAGRMDRYQLNANATIFIDYAHSPDALQHVLVAAQAHGQLPVIALFGCGGCRDDSKRKVMGAIAEEHATEIILTNDNPRSESPEKIIRDIQSGMKHPDNAHVIFDRGEAITTGIDKITTGGTLVIAGKGHESFTEIGNERIPWHDGQFVESAIRGVS